MKQLSILTVVAWGIVAALVALGLEALVTQVLWNLVTAPIIGVGRISFRVALAGFVTASLAGSVVQTAVLLLLGGARRP